MSRIVAAALILFAFGCSGSSGGTGNPEDAADVAGDVFFPTDTGADSDADGSAPDGTDTAEDTADAADTADCKTFGCECSANDDCLDGLCIESQDGFICTKVCSLECPPGFDCLTTTGFGPDPLSLCVPRHVPLCRPCMTHADCASLGAVSQGYCLPSEDPDDGSFCGTACEDGVPCPEGYDCATIALDGGGEARQCRPTTGLCECRPSWSSEPYETGCKVNNAAGACPGRRSCGPNGLLPCDGDAPVAETCNDQDEDCDGVTDDIVGQPCDITRGADTCIGETACEGGTEVCRGQIPTPEACNLEDDNCNGQTDEGGCFDNLTCTNDVCVGGSCSNELVLGACMIDGVCYEAGVTKPDDFCQICDPAVSTSSFTLATGVVCDDFDLCTKDDACSAGKCHGEAYVCDDGLSCTRDACDGRGGCTAPVSAGRCLIGDVCYEDGAKLSPNGCEVCDSTTSTTAWSAADGAPCDDADDCTNDDVCAGPGCHGAPYSCDDGDSCTTDVCTGDGECENTIAQSSCTIGGECFAAGFVKPDEPCYLCDPTKSNSTWSTAAPGTTCDDGDLCTTGDLCAAGVCEGTAYACDDGLACTDDACDGQGGCTGALATSVCVIDGICYPEGSRATAGGCLGCAPGLSDKAWSPLDGEACDDGLACTEDDACAADACAGIAYTCDDANACTIDRCNGDGTCDFAQATSSCIIGGTCYAAGVAKPDEPCLACRPEISISLWSSVAPGTSCDDGQDCTRDDACNGGNCNGVIYTCNDGLTCTTDTCDGAGGCDEAINTGTCLIDDVCYTAGSLDVAGGCRVCLPLVDNDAWTARDGEACDDGADCTHSDECAGESCGGTSYTCNDNLGCTTDSCDGDGTCTYTRNPGVCVIGGVCYADGASKPNEPCYACRSDISATSWSPAVAGTTCDDAQTCTKDDVCSNGICAGTTYTCNDGRTCTTDTCDGLGGCNTSINAGNCLIAGACVVTGTEETPGGCTWCNPAVDPNDWSAHDGAACNDGVACTHSDECQGSSCGGTTYTCNDSLACTNDSCDGDNTCTFTIVGGWCVIGGVCYAENTPKPGDECLACRPSLSTSDWRAVVNNSACDDENACTSLDKCTAGVCGGTPYTCNDTKPCTTDACLGDGTCEAPIDAGSCLISGVCYDDGDTRGAGADLCYVCNSEVSQESWFPNDGAACSDGALCTSGDHCTGSTCGGTTYSCEDNNACTLDSCTGTGTCNNIQATNTCIISGQCYAENFPKPGEPCFACRPDISGSTWSAVAAGAACDDGNTCTYTDKCNAGACSGTSYTCNDAFTCTDQTCNGTGGCNTTIVQNTCLIDGACRANGELQSAGGCLVCSPSQSPSAWFPNNGAACNDAQSCTHTDTCSGSTCGGTSYNCDDGKTCTDDSCNGNNTCTNALALGSCLIAGVCYSNNQINPSNPCQQCRTDTSTTTWSPIAGTVSCNDGNLCTNNDTCSAGSCVGNAFTCNDGLTCTSEVCNGTGCTVTTSAGKCLVGGVCYSDNDPDPSNTCKFCDADVNQAGFTNRPNLTACNDGQSCTHTDRCNATGTCGGTTYSCNDNKTCTSPDTCTGVPGGCSNPISTGCLIDGTCYNNLQDNPSNVCQECRRANSTTAWSPTNQGVSCGSESPVNPCTHTDVCNAAGACVGTPYGCDDGLTCTRDDCTGVPNGCSYPLISGCLISGSCYTNNETEPGNVCRKCNTSVSTSSWTNNNVSCSDGEVCTNGDFCSGGTCNANYIVDGWEYNNSFPGNHITNTNDCHDPFVFSLSATNYGPGDVDWYYFYADDAGCVLYPDVFLGNVPSNSDLDIDVYWECANGATPISFSCRRGSRIPGQYGCRSTAGGSNSERVTIDACCTEDSVFGVDCTGDDDGWVEVYVYKYQFAQQPTCNQPYSLWWGDDNF